MKFLILFFFGFAIVNSAPTDSAELATLENNRKVFKNMKKVLPSQDALEQIGVTFLDALIKAGQIEMAKGAFKTQLDVLKKVQPDQYKKYKDIPLQKLAADAVFEQSQQAQNQPKTGNRLIDMLHENGIPIGSSLKGIQQAIKTQREIENTDPSEQVAKAVFEKFQKQILPGLVANMIAGKNPFQIPQRADLQAMSHDRQRMFKMQHEEALKQIQEQQLKTLGKVQKDQFDLTPFLGNLPKSETKKDEEYEDESSSDDNTATTNAKEEEYEDGSQEEESESHNNVRHKRHLKSLQMRHKRQSRLIDSSEMLESGKVEEAEIKLGKKAAMLFGLYEADTIGENEEEETKPKEVRRQSKIPIELAEKILQSEKLRPLLSNDELAYKIADPEGLLEPKKALHDPNPQPGFVTPRPIPTRPRKMLTLLVAKNNLPTSNNNDDGDDEYEENNSVEEETSSEYESSKETTTKRPSEPFRRRHETQKRDLKTLEYEYRGTRTLNNLRNNPGIVQLFENPELVEKMSRSTVLRSSQRMGAGMPDKQTEIHPRIFGTKTLNGKELPPTKMDMKVKQIIEERDVPPIFFIPQGRHTRLRWTGATEKDIPGLGTRMVLPSLDPTMPAINSVVSTQGKARDEYDSTFKIPNYWNPGDVFGFDSKTVQERLIGGDGNVDFPAMQAGMNFG